MHSRCGKISVPNALSEGRSRQYADLRWFSLGSEPATWGSTPEDLMTEGLENADQIDRSWDILEMNEAQAVIILGNLHEVWQVIATGEPEVAAFTTGGISSCW